MKKVKQILNTNSIALVVFGLAIVLALVAIILLFARRGVDGTLADDGHRSVVAVASGDTLSKLLTDQGFTNADVLEIAKILKSDADVTSLRADNDKIEFVRTNADSPVSKIVIIHHGDK